MKANALAGLCVHYFAVSAAVILFSVFRNDYIWTVDFLEMIWMILWVVNSG